MSYKALYRKYRPNNFDEVVGQKIIVQTLINAIKNNRITHAYIFSGPRGTGKTSIAKIFAKTINCDNLKDYIPCNKCNNCLDYNNKKTVDIIEIDAASNNGVDEIRNLKSSVTLVPSNSKYKVYIIDEVHMLSTSAFNALLKTLEEPPKNVIFILATTELYKVPETIISRCQNFDFKRLTITDIANRLSYIAECEDIKIDSSALKAIAEYSNGGMRDAIGLLDQLSSYKNEEIKSEDVDEICGLISSEQTFELLNDILGNNLKDAIDKIVAYNDNGKNLNIIFEIIVDTLKNLLIYINASDYFSDDNLKSRYDYFSSKISEENIYSIVDELNNSIKNMKYDNNKLLIAQLCLIKINSLLNKDKVNDNRNDSNLQKKKENNISQEIIQNDNLSKKTDNKSWEIIKTNNFDEFKNVRINNTLALFNKKDLLQFKRKISVLKDYISNEKYGSMVSLLLDGELKAKGNEYIIYVYDDKKMTELFNNSLVDIEKFMLSIFKENLKMISVVLNDWEIIKKDFNNSLRTKKNKYVVKPAIELELIKTEKENINPNDIDNMFGEIVKYEKEEKI